MAIGALKTPPMMAFPEPPKELLGVILNRISEEQRRTAVKRLAFFSTGLVGLTAGLALAVQTAWAELAYSGSLKFAALLFSDFEIVMAAWDNFALLLLETLPAMSLAVLFSTLFIFLLIFRGWATELKSFRHFVYNK